MPLLCKLVSLAAFNDLLVCTGLDTGVGLNWSCKFSPVDSFSTELKVVVVTESALADFALKKIRIF